MPRGIASDTVPTARSLNAPGWCICSLLVLCAAAYSFHLVSFLHAKEAVLALGLVVLAMLRMRATPPGTQDGGVLAALWGTLGVVCITGLLFPRTAVPALLVEDGVRWAMLLLFAVLAWPLLAMARWRRRVLDALALAGALVSLLATMQYFGWLEALLPSFPHYEQPAYSVFGNQDLLGGFAALSLPAALLPRRGRWRWILPAACLALLAVALLISGSRTAWLAAAVGVAASAYQLRPRGQRGLPVLTLVALVVFVAALLALPQSRARIVGTFSPEDVGGRARLWFWDGTFRMIADAPITGVGLGNYPYHSPRYLGAALAAPGGEKHFHNRLHTLHAHSEPLEWIAETGLLGASILGWCVWRFVRRRRAMPRETVDAAAWGGLAALATFSCFNAGLHSAPHALAGLLFLGCLVVRADAPAPFRPLLPRVSALAAAVALAAFFAWTTLIPSVLRCAAEDAHVRGEDALALYARAAAFPWPQAQLRESQGIALLEAGRAEEAYAALQAARVGLDTGRLHLLLAEAARALGDEDAAARHLADCRARWPFEERADGEGAEP